MKAERYGGYQDEGYKSITMIIIVKYKAKVIYKEVKLDWVLFIINSRHACTARVTVLGSVCVSVETQLTYGASVHPENAVTYAAGKEGKTLCGYLPEMTALKSYATKHERKSQYANYSDLPAVSFPCLTPIEAPEGTQ